MFWKCGLSLRKPSRFVIWPPTYFDTVSLTARMTRVIRVIRWPDDHRLDVFAKSTSDTLIHKWWDAGTGWSS